MGLRIGKLATQIVALGVAIVLQALPGQAQVTDGQVGRLVEALRQVALQRGSSGSGLYSDWQVKGENIPRWSKSCLKRELTPSQFAADPATARTILTCVVGDVLRDEYRTSGNNETLAIQRTAAWWMTGDPQRYNSGDTAAYTKRVLTAYQQGSPVSSNAAPTNATPTPEASSPEPVTNPFYDRYMKAGYTATQQRDYETALLCFQRALDERPEDTYALQAIRNVESYRQSANPPTRGAASSDLSQPQAVALITQWLQAKAEIFAPPFSQQRVQDLTTGELYTTLLKPKGVINWLKQNQAYYRFGVQQVGPVSRFVTSGDRATLEVSITEERTLYRNGKVDPQQTDFNTHQVRYSLERVGNTWKVADYKTTNGTLLERAVLETETSSQ